MGVTCRLALAALVALPLAAQSGGPLTLRERAALHAGRVVSPMTVLSSAAGAGIGQWRAEPEEWGGGMAGYGRRYASSHGYAATQNLFQFGLGAAFNEDPRYQRSRRRGVGARLGHAITGTVLGPGRGRARAFRYSFAGSHLGASMLASAWHPDSSSSFGDGLTRAGINVALGVARSVAQEFWPEITAIFRLRPARSH